MKNNSINKEQIIQLYVSGLSSLKIAAQLEINKSTVLKTLKKAGIKRRLYSKSKVEQDPELLKSFLFDYKQGMSNANLVNKYSIATTTVKKLAIENNVHERRVCPRKSLDLEKAKQDYENGMTLAEVGALQGVTAMTVLKYFREAKIETKKPGQYWELGLRDNPTKNIGHTDEVKNILREKSTAYFAIEGNRAKASRLTTKAIAEGRLKPVSQLEEMVAQWFVEFDIDFKRQMPISVNFKSGFAYSVDFVVGNIAIEVNGTYWHSDPRFYPLGATTYSQKRVDKNYKAKKSIIYSKGMKLIELWEHDLNTNLEKTILNCLNQIEVYQSLEMETHYQKLVLLQN